MRTSLSRRVEALRFAAARHAGALASGLALALSLASCSGSPEVDLSKLRVFFSSDALGYLEPCG
jgi:hypothetical protein